MKYLKKNKTTKRTYNQMISQYQEEKIDKQSNPQHKLKSKANDLLIVKNEPLSIIINTKKDIFTYFQLDKSSYNLNPYIIIPHINLIENTKHNREINKYIYHKVITNIIKKKCYL